MVIAIGAFMIWRYSTPEARAWRELVLVRENFRTLTPGYYQQTDMVKVLDHMGRYFTDMGTNAIPILLQWIEEAAAPQSALKRQAVAFGGRVKLQSTQFWIWTENNDARMRGLVASQTLPLFGEKAAWTVPRLQQLAATNTKGAADAKHALHGMAATGAHRQPSSAGSL